MLNNNTHMTQATASMWTGRNSWEEYVALERYCYTHSTDTYSEHITPSPPPLFHPPPSLQNIVLQPQYSCCVIEGVSTTPWWGYYSDPCWGVMVCVCKMKSWGCLYCTVWCHCPHTVYYIILGEGEYNLYTYCMLYKPWPVEEDKGIFSKLKKKSKIVKHWKSLI